MNAWLEFGLSNGVAATLLALGAALTTRFCRRPQVVLVLWLLVLAKLLAPPIVGLPAVSLRSYLPVEPAPSSIDDAAFDVPDTDPLLAAEMEFAELASQEQLHALPTDPVLDVESPLASDPPLAAQQGTPLADAALAPLRSNWLPRAIFWTWVTGSALWFAIAAARIARFARLIRHAEPADRAMQDEVWQLAQRIGISRVPQVRVARRRVPPLVWGMSGKPTLLLPAELLENLSHEQRATLLAHELAHVARRDDLVRWFELAAIGLYWWHPVAWWARYNAEAAQEQCCDARVMSLLPNAARAYAETLLATIEFLAEPGRKVPLGASGFSQVGHMHRRLTMILKRNTSGRMSWTMTASLAALGFLVLPVSLHTLWAEPAPEGELEAAVETLENQAERAGEVELFAETSEPEAKAEEVEVEKGFYEPKIEVAEALAEPKPDEESSEENDEIDPAIERRLDRLEMMIKKLAAHVMESDKDGKPAIPSETKPATKSEKGWRAYAKPLQDPEPDQDWSEIAELKKKIASATDPADKRKLRAAAEKMLIEKAADEGAKVAKKRALEIDHRLAEQAGDVVKEHFEARARELTVQEAHYRLQLDKAKRAMGELEMKKAAIEMELAKEAARLQERHEELKAMYLKQRAILENDLDAEKLKAMAAEKKMKVMKEKEPSREKKEKEAAEKEESEEPDDDDGAKRSQTVPAVRYKLTHLSANCSECHSGLPEDAVSLRPGASSQSCERASLVQLLGDHRY